jgi:hypothetical protein
VVLIYRQILQSCQQLKRLAALQRAEGETTECKWRRVEGRAKVRLGSRSTPLIKPTGLYLMTISSSHDADIPPKLAIPETKIDEHGQHAYTIVSLFQPNNSSLQSLRTLRTTFNLSRKCKGTTWSQSMHICLAWLSKLQGNRKQKRLGWSRVVQPEKNKALTIAVKPVKRRGIAVTAISRGFAVTCDRCSNNQPDWLRTRID